MRAYFVDSVLEVMVNTFIDRGELDCGDTKRFDHDECGDTRGRGYVSCKHREKGGGLVDLFYCHNCGASAARERRGSGRSRTTAPPTDEAEATVELPKDAVPMIDPAVPGHIRHWAENFRVCDDVLWSTSMGRIVMPVYEPQAFSRPQLLGYQARRDPEGSVNIPKYLTVCGRDKPLRLIVTPHAYGMSQQNTVVIVEDWVSAHQFRNLAGVWGAGLLGLNATAEYVLWVDTHLQSYTGSQPQYLVWLDNDVKKSFEVRCYLQRLLQTLGRRVDVQTTLNDPKDYSEQVIHDTIRGSCVGVP